MSRNQDILREDRELRDAAKAVLLADLEHAKASFSAKGVATRIGGRIGDGAKDVLEVAKVQADDNRGVIAMLIGAIALWMGRTPILEILGLATPASQDEVHDATSDDAGDDELINDGATMDAQVNSSGDDDEQ